MATTKIVATATPWIIFLGTSILCISATRWFTVDPFTTKLTSPVPSKSSKGDEKQENTPIEASVGAAATNRLVKVAPDFPPICQILPDE
eukprot:12580270-Ditylum_brightwellii.AAC.1